MLFNTIQGVGLEKRFDRNLLKYSAQGSFDPIEKNYLHTDEETVGAIILLHGQLNFNDPSGELVPATVAGWVLLGTFAIRFVEWALYHLQGKAYDPSRNLVPPKIPGSRSGPNLPRDRRAPTVCPAARGR